jgi:hypothetical protein
MFILGGNSLPPGIRHQSRNDPRWQASQRYCELQDLLGPYNQSMGLFVAISAGYISEVAGPKTRATVMSCLAASPLIGIIAAVGTGSNPKVIGNLSDWGSWKLIFACEC